jgi:hypothetical protein
MKRTELKRRKSMPKGKPLRRIERLLPGGPTRRLKRKVAGLRAPGTPARPDRGWNSSLKPGKPLKARKVSKRFADRRDPGYCRWIRTLACCVAGREASSTRCWPCAGRVECAHVVSRGAGGFDVANTVPLCTRHHRQQHAMGIQSFEDRYRIDLEMKALYYGARQPPKCERDNPNFYKGSAA